MAKFLTYDINQVIINNNLFPANSISFQLAANTVPVRDINGNLLYYSPTSPIQGSVSINFFLTGAIPSYLRLENQNEIANTIAFNQLAVPGCHLTNLSFSVRPFEPIPVKADFVFYHGIRALNTNLIQYASSFNGPIPGFQINQSFNSGLNILNGMSSYIITDDRSTYIQNPADFVVTDFDYQFSVERVPILRVGEYFPLRVAMKEINAEFNITASNLDGVLDIKGNSAVFSAVLKDNTDANVSDTINLTGIIVNQSYEISEDNFGFSKIKMMQSLNKKRSSITIPMEVNNPNIVNPPTNNNNVIILPPTSVTSTEIINSTKPNPEEPNIGTGTSDPKLPVDDTVWYYVEVLINVKMINAENAYCSSVELFSSSSSSGFDEYVNGSQKFSILSNRSTLNYNPSDKQYYDETKKQFNYNEDGVIMTFKATADFITAFDVSSNTNTNDFINYRGAPCKPTNSANSQGTATYQRFFNNIGSAINDTHKDRKTPYKLNISLFNNEVYELAFFY